MKTRRGLFPPQTWGQPGVIRTPLPPCSLQTQRSTHEPGLRRSFALCPGAGCKQIGRSRAPRGTRL